MDDRFLKEYSREPRPGFARALRERLREQEQEQNEFARPWFRPQPALAAAFAVVLVAGLFTMPALRATARELLDLFRVRNLTAVPFDPERLERLESLVEGRKDAPGLIGFRTEVLREPGEPRVFDTPQAASSAAGLSVRTPSYLPRGFKLEKIMVSDEGEARMTVDVRALDSALELLELRDVRVPSEWDGRSLLVRMPRSVSMHYADGDRRAYLRQAAAPEVELPPGADLAQMGEIALRVLGLDAHEARRTASRIDWNSTLIVPVPIDATSFREVTIQGNKGLLVQTQRDDDSGDKRKRGALVLWTEDGRVFALAGNMDGGELVVMAESVR